MTYAAYRQAGPGAAFSPIPSGLRIAFLVAMIAELGSLVATIASSSVMFATLDKDTPPSSVILVFVFGSYLGLFLTLAVSVGLGIAWMHKAWSWLPVDQRYARNWKSWITPAQASLFLLIPYFHYYWIFIVNPGLCDALDRLRVIYPTKAPAPKQLALAACILQILFWPAALVCLYLYMRRVEEMTKEMSEAANARRAAAF